MCWFLYPPSRFWFPGPPISIHQMCWFLFYWVPDFLPGGQISIHQMCWFLSLGVPLGTLINQISIHQMCWFLFRHPLTRQVFLSFQYIKCVGFSVIIHCPNLAAFQISIHQMCWFLSHLTAGIPQSLHFNTSNVLVSR